jgi:hypothetical protein
MVIVTSATQFKDMIDNGELCITKKPQKVDGDNYFLSPNIGFRLYGAQVIQNNENYLVLGFDKIRDISLYSMLSYMDKRIRDYLKTSYIIQSDVFHSLFSETESSFTIRCYLPHLGKRYFTECESDGKQVAFRVPNKFATIDVAYVEIRNVWECRNRLGFNIELKSVVI